MGAHGDYLEKDRVAARNFGEAARQAGVRRIVYLGGLATGEEVLSKHLKSRIETGQVLRESGVPVVEFRASVVIGSGSLSFELIRALVERLPVMICPRWVSTLAQPIGIDDLLAYLVAALHLPDGESRTFEIGGADQASYGDVMREYATAARAEARDDLGAVADPSPVESLARTRHACLCPGRARTDRGAEEPVRGHRSRGAFGLPDQARRPAGRDRSRHSLRGSRVRADAVVRCALLGRGPDVAGRDAIRQQAGRCTADSRGRRRGPCVRAHREDRGRARVVLRARGCGESEARSTC